MTHSFVYRNVTEGLRDLCEQIMTHGADVPSRNGMTKELTHVHVELTKPLEREIQLVGRGHSLPAQIAESMWILAGRNDVEFLANYLPRSPQFSDDGKVWRAGYGPRLRRWRDIQGEVDQIKFVVELLQKDPGTRRAVASIWDPRVDTTPGKDIPCNDWLHFIARTELGNEHVHRLDLHVAVRSNDLIWGWSGINAFEWSVLLEVVARLAGMEVGSLHFSISSLHVYEQHWEKARRLAKAPAGFFTPLPRFDLARYTPGPLEVGDGFRYFEQAVHQWFRCEEMIRNGQPVPISERPNDSLLDYWLDVIAGYWGEKRAEAPADPFADKVEKLHNQKHAAYGNSWMKRGELFSIIPNVARKMDRLGSGKDTDDETQADTAVDLLVYLAKYRLWLSENIASPVPDGVRAGHSSLTTVPGPTNQLVAAVDTSGYQDMEDAVIIRALESYFEDLLVEVERQHDARYRLVDAMLPLASTLARRYDRG